MRRNPKGFRFPKIQLAHSLLAPNEEAPMSVQGGMIREDCSRGLLPATVLRCEEKRPCWVPRPVHPASLLPTTHTRWLAGMVAVSRTPGSPETEGKRQVHSHWDHTSQAPQLLLVMSRATSPIFPRQEEMHKYGK